MFPSFWVDICEAFSVGSQASAHCTQEATAVARTWQCGEYAMWGLRDDHRVCCLTVHYVRSSFLVTGEDE